MLKLLLIISLTLAAIDPLLITFAVGMIAPVGAYLMAARKMSGKIATTEAHDLWEESRAIREWSSARIDKCDEEIARLQSELREAKIRISELEKDKRNLERMLREREDHLDF
jgi:predicted RNase H-like nuclease (RuvC/YqgF family)